MVDNRSSKKLAAGARRAFGSHLVRALAGVSALAGTACGDGGASTDAEPGTTTGPLYAMHTVVFDPDFNAMSYVALANSLDVDEFPFDEAREFPGYAFVSAIDGRLMVSGGESPTITLYDVTDQRRWVERDRLSFAGYGLSEGQAGFERHWFASETTAYLTFDVTARLVWDPKNFEIKGVAEDSELPAELDGLELDATFNRQPRIASGPVLKPFFFHDYDWFEFAPSTLVATYDPETHAETSIVDVPCPALEVPSVDEAGNTYLSAWTFGPVLALYGVGPELCVRRIAPDATLDETWTPDLTTYTEGRPVKVFRYWRDGKALGTVLHTEELDADFEGPYDPDVDAEAEAHYRLWLFDLDAETAAPVDGIGRIDSGFHWATIDGRTFVFVPTEDWRTTEVYEVTLDGQATPRFGATGRLTEWIRVR